jgi:hypothetical protein
MDYKLTQQENSRMPHKKRENNKQNNSTAKAEEQKI